MEFSEFPAVPERNNLEGFTCIGLRFNSYRARVRWWDGLNNYIPKRISKEFAHGTNVLNASPTQGLLQTCIKAI